MRLYNPDYEKNKKKYEKRNGRRSAFAAILSLLIIAAAIGVLIYLFVIKAAWYYYAIDIVVGLLLFGIAGAFYPKKGDGKYVDILLPSDEITAEMVKERFPEDPIIKREIFHGIAVCECGKVYKPDDISFSVSNRSSKTVHTESGNMYTSAVADVEIKCKCSKCGKECKQTCHNVERSTGSRIQKRSFFSDTTTVTSTSYDADFGQYVADVYEDDKKRYEKEKAEYARFIEKKKRELKLSAEKNYEANMKRVADLKAKGWYEKGEKPTAKKKKTSANDDGSTKDE